MSNVAIRVENLGKQYQIGKQEANYKTLRDALTDVVFAPARRLQAVWRNQGAGTGSETFWALTDVSFEVKHGEVIGVIGHNGAGKSTLLKILSRITAPSTGHAEIRGRVGSLLEVGTGFHPELTGRENIYLNGAILGMHKSEIERKFDEIVDFSGIEKFIDTPVKRYSSGMQVRLAFAVAAHLEPEILMIDEVLAVGDAAFQKKCIGKMTDVAHEGRTVLFVSHNMSAVVNLCQRGILLNRGGIASQGEIADVTKEYITQVSRPGLQVPIQEREDRRGNGALRFTSMVVKTQDQPQTDTVSMGDCVEILLDYESTNGKPLQNVALAIGFFNHLGQHMFMCQTKATGEDYEEVPARGQFIARIPEMPLMEGTFSLNIFCEVNGVIADWIINAFQLNVVGGDFFGTGKVTPASHGGMLVRHSWKLN